MACNEVHHRSAVFNRSPLLVLALLGPGGCGWLSSGGTGDSSSANDSGSDTGSGEDTAEPADETTDTAGDTADTAAPAAPDLALAERTDTWLGNRETMFFGSDLVQVDGGLLISAPGSGWYTEKHTNQSVYGLEWPLPTPVWGAQLIYGVLTPVDDTGFQYRKHRIGAKMSAVGDLTGDGVDDLVLFEDYVLSETEGNAFLVPGPIVPGADEVLPVEDPGVVRFWLGRPAHGARCGDLNRDGAADMCSSAGFFFGPFTSFTSSPDLHGVPDIPLAEGTVITSLGTSGDGVVVLQPDTGTILVTRQISDTVVPFDQATAITSAHSPTMLATNAPGTLVVASARNSGWLEVFDTSTGTTVASGQIAAEVEAVALAQLAAPAAAELVVLTTTDVRVYDIDSGSLTELVTWPLPTPETISVGGYDGIDLASNLLVGDLDGDEWAEVVVGIPAAISETNSVGWVVAFDP